jgi:hypothetical protein
MFNKYLHENNIDTFTHIFQLPRVHNFTVCSYLDYSPKSKQRIILHRK